MPINDFYIGDTKTLNFAITKESDSSAIDISGWEIYVTFKWDKEDSDGDAILQKVFVMPNDANSIAGTGIGVLTSDDTNQFIEEGNYHYDIQRVIVGNPPDVATLEIGKLKVLYGVTRVDVPHDHIPDVSAITEAAAGTVLVNAGFVVGATTTEASTTIDVGDVIRTDPIARTYEPIGNTIDLVVAV